MQKSKSPHADQKYIDGLLNNKVALIEEIYKKWGPEVRNFIIKNNGTAEDAKDIFQETIAAVLLKIRKEKFILTVPLGGYLYFIYRAKWFNKLSKNKKEPVIIDDIYRYTNETDTNQPAAEAAQLLENRLEILKNSFKKLSEKCQQILNAKYKEGLKSILVMQQMQLPSVGAVNKKTYDCRENLRKLLIKHPEFINLNI